MAQAPDTKEGNYYVSVVDGPQHALLLGPFCNDHAKALSLVEKARDEAVRIDRKAWFYGFGTCRLPLDYDKPGKLNYLLEED